MPLPLFGDLKDFIGVIQDIADPKQVEEDLKKRVHQRAVIAKLVQYLLTDLNLSALMDEAIILVTQSLEVKLYKVLELLSEGNTWLLWQMLVGTGS